MIKRLDLYRIHYRTQFAGESRLVWAYSKEGAEAVGRAWCNDRTDSVPSRLISVELETVGSEAEEAPSVAPSAPQASTRPIKATA